MILIAWAKNRYSDLGWFTNEIIYQNVYFLGNGLFVINFMFRLQKKRRIFPGQNDKKYPPLS